MSLQLDHKNVILKTCDVYKIREYDIFNNKNMNIYMYEEAVKKV